MARRQVHDTLRYALLQRIPRHTSAVGRKLDRGCVEVSQTPFRGGPGLKIWGRDGFAEASLGRRDTFCGWLKSPCFLLGLFGNWRRGSLTIPFPHFYVVPLSCMPETMLCLRRQSRFHLLSSTFLTSCPQSALLLKTLFSNFHEASLRSKGRLLRFSQGLLRHGLDQCLAFFCLPFKLRNLGL